MGIPQRQRIQVLTQKLGLRVPDAIRVAPVPELLPKVGREPQAMIRLPQEHRPRVGGDPKIRLTQLDRPVIRRLEEPALAFTHRGILPFCSCGSAYPLSTRRNGFVPAEN